MSDGLAWDSGWVRGVSAVRLNGDGVQVRCDFLLLLYVAVGDSDMGIEAVL